MGKTGMLKRSLIAVAVSATLIGGSAVAVGAQDEVATPDSSPVAASEAAPSASLPNTGAGAAESSSNDMLLLALLGVGGVAGTVGVVATKRSHR